MTLAPPELRELRVPRARREPRVHKGSREPRGTLAQKALRALRGRKERKVRKEMLARLALRAPSGRLASFQGPWDRPPLSRGPRGRKAPKETMATLD